jgi:peptide-methionine (S)-S-oxide reductase
MKNCLKLINFSLILLLFIACDSQVVKSQQPDKQSQKTNMSQTDTITLGAGCFWCVEAVLQQVNGVVSVKSGYSGGSIKNPTYKEICSGLTGHAEVCQVVYQPDVISLPELLKIFWYTHDPTQLNRQGNDIGTQYRSAIFYHNDSQKQIAETLKAELDKSGAWDKPIVTEISAFTIFYTAEDYHQNYYNENSDQPYCSYVIKPKLEKFDKVFSEYKKK